MKQKQDSFHEKYVSNKDAIVRARKKWARFGGRLKIVKYPMGRCTVAETERLLNELESIEGFIPDVLIIDYIDIMNLSDLAKDTRDQLNRAYIWAKGMADERNILIITPSQIRRESLDRRLFSKKDAAEDIRKVANADLILGIGRDEKDAKMNLATMNILGNRSGPQNFSCTFSLCFAIGQFCISSWTGSDLNAKVYEAFGSD